MLPPSAPCKNGNDSMSNCEKIVHVGLYFQLGGYVIKPSDQVRPLGVTIMQWTLGSTSMSQMSARHVSSGFDVFIVRWTLRLYLCHIADRLGFHTEEHYCASFRSSRSSPSPSALCQTSSSVCSTCSAQHLRDSGFTCRRTHSLELTA